MSMLEINELTFRDRGPYSLAIGAGECVGLMGPSGSGKTLLLRAIADLDPHGGRMRLDDTFCRDIPAPRWRQLVGMLPAESCWWYDRVADHFLDFTAIDQQDLAMLGFDREVGSWQVSRLSTGEKQRLAILRLLENKPSALLLDEPTASLDQAAIGRVEKLLTDFRVRHKAPVLWVSHDPEQLGRMAGLCLVMDDNGQLRGGK